MFCKKCGTDIGNSKYCSNCGQHSEVKSCKKCGANIGDSEYCPICGQHSETKFCKKCGADIGDSEYCPNCGLSTKANFCKKCGADIGDSEYCPNCERHSEAKFCKKCGEYIGKSKYCPKCGQSADAPVKYEQKNGVKVNKIAYGLIAIFLGDLGIHRFYARKIPSGIIYLLFCWTAIPGILGLVEGILALVKPSDENGDLTVDPDSFFV